jgi:hypothetical protein
MAIIFEPGINISGGILISSLPPGPPSPAVTFGTPTIMNSGAFVSLLQPNSTDIDPSGLIAVVGQNGGNFGSAVSSNGTTWTGPTLNISGNTFIARMVWSSIHGYYLAIGSGPSPNSYPIYTTSSDGVTWSSTAVANATTISNIWALAVNSAGVFAAIVYIPSVGPGYMTSADGVTWTTPTAIPGATSGVFFFNASITVDSSGKFVATGYEGFSSTPWSAVSANGSTWTAQQISGSTFTPRTVTWSSYHNLFVTVGAITGGLGYMTSADGVTWSTPTAITGSTSAMSILSMTVNSAGVFVGVGQIQGASTTPIYMTSTNGTDWCVPTSFNGSTAVGFMRGIVYSPGYGGKFVAVGADNTGPNWIYAVSS